MLLFFLFVCIFSLIIYIYRFKTTQRVSSAQTPSCSSTLITFPEPKYDVFLSFRGEDTRDNFTSHLYTALCSHNIYTFIDDKLERGEEISQSLLNTIQGSKLSVIIFSENYASSTWCLDELVTILTCHEKYGQAVIPIFYCVDPSDVRKQKGSYEYAFAKHRKLPKERVQSWRAALEEAANLSGLDSHNFKSESEYVKEIMSFVVNKLHEMSPPREPKGLVGINPRIKELESLLNMGTRDVRIVGIWGMAGIGKTTLAKAVFDRFYTQFEGSCFLECVGDKLDSHGAVDVQKQLLSEILDRDHILEHPLSSGNSFIKDLLDRRKVLIVLDDVWSFRKLQELLLLQHDSFGAGSKIIVTSRDKQVLNNSQVDETYEVKRLDYCEARQLFCKQAFKNDNCPIDYTDLLERAESYAQGNPLALTVLGAALCGKSEEEWQGALSKLALHSDIQNVLRISYDKLDPEQREIFLNFAHYFRGCTRNHATVMLEALHRRSVRYDISNLIDKCLITVRTDYLEMHDLVHLMARSIGRADSKTPGKRKRLCDPEDVISVLTRKKGTEHIEGICLDISKLSGEVQLSSDAFASMEGLRFLKFYFSWRGYNDKVFLPPCGLEYISDQLIYFRWDRFPSKSLPPNFCSANLIDLDLSFSNVVKLWDGVQNVVNLRKVNLIGCSNLMELPDLSKAYNLEELNLTFCTSLIEIPSFFQYLENLREVNLMYCLRLMELPDLSKAYNLEVLNLCWCTSLIEVPSFLQCLDNLKHLDLFCCENLERLPGRIGSKVLRAFIMEGCSKMKKCPEIISTELDKLYLSGTAIGGLEESVNKLLSLNHDIRFLDLSESAIKEIPPSIQFLTSLEDFRIFGCTQLSSLPSSIYKLKLKKLNLDGCLKLERLPDIMEPVKSLTHLFLVNTAIKELPSSIKKLIALYSLDLRGTPIKELPELPSSLLRLYANDCESLETLSSFKVRNLKLLYFANCFKLDQKGVREELQLKFQSGEISRYRNDEVLLSGSQIPSWFCYQNVGSSFTVQLPSNRHQLKGLVFCLVFSFSLLESPYYISHQSRRLMGNLINFKINATSKNDNIIHKMDWKPDFNPLKIHDSDYMLLRYMDKSRFREICGNEVTFDFFPMEGRGFSYVSNDEKILLREIFKQCKVVKCGVFFVFDENAPISMRI